MHQHKKGCLLRDVRSVKVYTRGTLPRQKSRIYCSKPANVFKASRDALDGDKAAINLQNDRAIDSNINVKKKKKTSRSKVCHMLGYERVI